MSQAFIRLDFANFLLNFTGCRLFSFLTSFTRLSRVGSYATKSWEQMRAIDPITIGNRKVKIGFIFFIEIILVFLRDTINVFFQRY